MDLPLCSNASCLSCEHRRTEPAIEPPPRFAYHPPHEGPSLLRTAAAFALVRHPGRDPRDPFVLLVERREAPGTWSLPGGKVEPSDVVASAAALRELHEETGLRGAIERHLATVPGTHIPGRNLHVFEVIAPGAASVLADHGPEGDALAWGTIDNLRPFFPEALVEALREALA